MFISTVWPGGSSDPTEPAVSSTDARRCEMVRVCSLWGLTIGSEATADATSASSASAAGGALLQSDQGCVRTISPAPASVVCEAPRPSRPFAEVDEMAELVGPLMRGALASLGIDAVTPADTGRAPVESCDLIIVGGGPAGLAAGLYAARMNLKTVLVNGGPIGGQLLNTELIEDYPGFESISGGDLASKMGDHARKFGLDIREFEPVEAVEVGPGGTKVARLESGRELHAPALVFAAGGRPRKLDVPGEAEFAGRGVSYCAVCDGAFFQGQELAVVGGGDAALEEADFLTRYASRVTVIHRRGQLRAQPILQARARANPSIDFILGARVREIHGNGVVS